MVADGPEPTVTVDPGPRVCPEIMYSDELSGVIVLFPTTIGRTLLVVGAIGVAYIVEADDPICRMVSERSVDRAMMVVDGLEPTVIDDPGIRVWPEMMYRDDASGAIVLPSTMIDTTLSVDAIPGCVSIVDTDVPTCRTVSEGLVDKATTVLDDSEPAVTDDPGRSVWPEMMY